LRVRAARRVLGLDPPVRWGGTARLAALVCALALLGLAAAQPAITRSATVRERTGVAALFVLDISRSMAASASATSPTRLDRAVKAAVALRAAIPDVPAGVATLTDRVLPQLLPVSDLAGFTGVVQRAVAIEQPQPIAASVVATTYGVLGEIATGNYFDPRVTRRVVVLLSDGESNPFDPGGVASALPASRGYRLMAVRFWNAGEAVFDSAGRPEPGYHPNPVGAAILSGLAAATGGRAFDEGELGAAADYLRRLVGTGPSSSSPGVVPAPQALAPYLALVALLLLAAAIVPLPAGLRAIAPSLSSRRLRGRATATRKTTRL